ncbi:MAG: type II toxin-antitoxin system Phd/YefM family antitoxin [Cyanobium sp.]
MASAHDLPAARPPATAPGMVNVQEAKTHLSALLARVAAGERIVLARHGKPIAQLVPLDPAPRRELGFLEGRVGDDFFDPLPQEELERWGT